MLWAGVLGGGLDRLDLNSGQFTHYWHDPADASSLSDNYVNVIHQDGSGTLWVGTDGGLNSYDRQSGTFHLHSTGTDTGGQETVEIVRAILEDQHGDLWVGTWGGGLRRLDRESGQFRSYYRAPSDQGSLATNYIAALFEDSTGRLWAGTNDGLHLYDRVKDVLRRYADEGELQGREINAILEDESGHLWVSTEFGLSKFDPDTGVFANYDAGDGLQQNGYSGAACRLRSGEMLFGGPDGIDAFFPQQVHDNPFVPPVVLLSMHQDGKASNAGQALEKASSLEISWPQNSMDFEFAALSYSQPQRNQHAYLLDGYDEDWNYIGTERTGSYADLPGGQYTLRLRGSNDDGVWNEVGTSIQLRVRPPFWATWWFRGAAVLVVAAAVFTGYRLRVIGMQAQSRELEVQVRARTQEIEQRRKELEALFRADEELLSRLELDEVLQALVDIAVDILKADKSLVLCWDSQGNNLMVRVARGFGVAALAQLTFARDEGLVGQVVTSGQPVTARDVSTDKRLGAERPELVTSLLADRVRSFMLLPIKVDGQVFGVFNVSFGVPYAFGKDQERLFTALAQRAAMAIENAKLYEQIQQVAVVEERGRLARDLHDAVTQTLFSASLIAETLPEMWENDQEEGQQLLTELRQLNRGALAEMRTLLMELRPAALADADLGGLLRQLTEAATGRTGVPVTLVTEQVPALPPDVRVAFYRIAQEALNNVVKHANASQIEMWLAPAWRSSRIDKTGVKGVVLEVSDNGCGFDPELASSDGLGLDIIRERAQAIGATMDIESSPNAGTRVSVVWEEERE
jgi:signal transduction histidine kinase